ncbi:1-phosphofructokinase family hexose kinase [Mycolicibacterium sp. ND9-15]|uniref:1-phosphofructokinase family hexose kinase n=1 Tax=Mycolicibacterium sp. ND9-15 TaxID=3042320 RepID=UPI002DD80CA2|nr:1-phosphofructokinase family hexose kinase [Mycolicibacterium sp. ND9-15]WSE58852.1 1-phosphofructokinase family hexose kinase [Mycolicibacterium sp. ND9-15]
MNPALDVTIDADVVQHTSKIRCAGARYDPGGGGVNVARFVRVLGGSVAAVFPAGGPTGAVVTDLVAQADVPVRRVPVKNATRESFTVNETSTGKQFRFVFPGPALDSAEQDQCLDELRADAATAEIVVASGSLPPGVPVDFFNRVADICRELGVLLILDTWGGGLRHVQSGVFLMKPSLRELRECVGLPLETEAEQLAAAHGLIDRGVTQAVIVSLGSDGALLATPHESYKFPPVPVEPISSVGAGDAMVTGITIGLTRAWPLVKSVRFGIAAATAKLRMPGTAAFTSADVERFFEMVPEPTQITGEIGAVRD